MKLLLALVLLCGSLVSQASQNSKPALLEHDGYLLKVYFKFKNDKRVVETKSEFIISQFNHDWTPLTEGKDGVVLIGQIEMGDDGIVSTRYMVVDSSSLPVGLTQMGIIAQLGKNAMIKSSNEKESLEIGILINETKYTRK